MVNAGQSYSGLTAEGALSILVDAIGESGDERSRLERAIGHAAATIGVEPLALAKDMVRVVGGRARQLVAGIVTEWSALRYEAGCCS